MLKKPLAKILLLSLTATLLTACVTEPRDPAFAGAEAVDENEASKTRVSLGLTYLKTGDFSRAKANLDKALEFAPRSANANFAMAYYYQQVDEVNLAEEYYGRALRYDESNADIINSYGAFLCEQGKYNRAKSYFLEAVNNKSYISTAETYENLAICAQSQGRPSEALGFYESALNHQPTRSRSLFLLAQLQAEQGNYGDAKKTLWKYDRVSQVSPQSLWLSFDIARGLGDTKAALGYGEILKSMYPNHPNTERFKVEMDNFEPRSKVTSKRKVELETTPVIDANANTVSANALIVEPLDVNTPTADSETTDTEAVDVAAEGNTELPVNQTPDANTDEAATNESPVLVTKKKSKVLQPTEIEPAIDETPLSDPESQALLSQATELVTEIAETVESTELEKKEMTDTADNALSNAEIPAIIAEPEPEPELSSEEYSKREAELEAAFTAGAPETDAPETDVPAPTPTGEQQKSADDITEIAEEVVAQADTAAEEADAFHIVKAKENLYQISLRYNVQMKSLMEWNDLKDASSIRIGTKLRVKGPINND